MVINLFLSHESMGEEGHLRVEMSHVAQAVVQFHTSVCRRCSECDNGLGGGGLFARFLSVCIHAEAEADRLGNRRLLWTPAM